jgi:serine palmitoyltransferase
VCDHQRLSGQGYCFSASLPPYLATAAQAALQQLEVPDVQQRAAALRAAAAELRRSLQQIPGLVLPGMPEAAASPLVHLQLSAGVLSALAAQSAPAAAAAVEGMAKGTGAAGLGQKAARGGKQAVAAAAAAAAARQAAEGLLQRLADRLIQRHGVLVAVPRYSQLDRAPPPPSLKLYVNAGLLQKGKVAVVAAAVAEAAQNVGLEALVKASSNGKRR